MSTTTPQAQTPVAMGKRSTSWLMDLGLALLIGLAGALLADWLQFDAAPIIGAWAPPAAAGCVVYYVLWRQRRNLSTSGGGGSTTVKDATSATISWLTDAGVSMLAGAAAGWFVSLLTAKEAMGGFIPPLAAGLVAFLVLWRQRTNLKKPPPSYA